MSNAFMNFQKRFLMISFLMFALCSIGFAQKTKTMVFSYSDFGPQVSAYELIGFEWFQWNHYGSSDPKQIDDIKVVVYRGISLKKVKKMYPVNKKMKADYRYLDYRSAINYLKKHEKDEILENLTKTNKKIIETLGK